MAGRVEVGEPEGPILPVDDPGAAVQVVEVNGVPRAVTVVHDDVGGPAGIGTSHRRADLFSQPAPLSRAAFKILQGQVVATLPLIHPCHALQVRHKVYLHAPVSFVCLWLASSRSQSDIKPCRTMPVNENF